MSILEVNQVYKHFGGVKANEDISLSVEQGSIVGLIGPNGSGKTTLFNSIVGTHPIDKGSIKFDGKEVSELPVPVVAKLGLLRTFQQTRIYGKLNCIENMLISNKSQEKGLLSVFSKIPPELTDKAENLLKFVGLHQKRKLRAGDLSFGQQKLLELAMALMNEPKMLLLDEPTAGINPTLINGIIDRLIKVNKEFGITLLVIEHNMRVIMQLAQKIFCLAHGEMLAEGTPEQIKNDKRVIDAYLGVQ
jgi:branched-chain amino acid transport system ATP-binding protein